VALFTVTLLGGFIHGGALNKDVEEADREKKATEGGPCVKSPRRV
jgi:hypothetical protein